MKDVTSNIGGVVILLLLGVPAPLLMAQEGQRPGDKWMDIAAVKTDYSNRKLTEIVPSPISKHLLPLDADANAAAFQPAAKMTTVEQLREELQRQREHLAPYLKDLAPPLEDVRIRVPLESFDWRVETAEDRADFPATLAGQGQWQRVKIPHYGPPMGRAVTYYRTTSTSRQAMLDKGALFVHFKGVDYKAHVFVNGALLGSHEGFFAPFEFEFTPHARLGKNVLLVKVVNDFIMIGQQCQAGLCSAATADTRATRSTPPSARAGTNRKSAGTIARRAWASIKTCRSKPGRRIHVHDIFVRPLAEEGKAEAWIEVFNCDPKPENVGIRVVGFRPNFSAHGRCTASRSAPASKAFMAGRQLLQDSA